MNLHKQSIVTYKLAIIKLYDPTPVLDKHEAEFIFGKHHNFADETNIIPVGANCEVSTQESNNSTLKYPFIPNQIISIGFLRFKSDDFSRVIPILSNLNDKLRKVPFKMELF